MEVAVDLAGDVLGRLDDVFDRHGLRFTRQRIATLGAAGRLHESRAPEAQQDLFNVVVRQAFLIGEFARRYRPLPRALGEMEGHDEAVFSPGGDAHNCNMRESLSGFNAPTAGSRSLPPATETRCP